MLINFIKEIDDDSWIIGDKIILSRQSSPASKSSWSDEGSFYTISESISPPPLSRPLPTTSHIKLVYDAGGVSAVWSIGNTFCKIKVLSQNTTREHITLDYLSKQQLSFAIPTVRYHLEHDGCYYIFLSKVAGVTLNEIWPILDEMSKQHYIQRIANICQELAQWENGSICGVDGSNLSDSFLTKLGDTNSSPENIRFGCEQLQMDCSTFLFYHCDLGPGNILVVPSEGTVGIIDWETAGFVPKEWIRTKFCISSGMNLASGDPVDWRRRVFRQLGVDGYREVADEWLIWWRGS